MTFGELIRLATRKPTEHKRGRLVNFAAPGLFRREGAVWLIMNGNTAAGKIAGGGIAGAGLDVESVERAGISVIGDIHGKADLLMFADFIDAGEMGVAAGREGQIG